MKTAERILLVDDDRTFRTVTKSFLEEAGYAVEVSESAELAEQKLRDQQYDLVLTDLVMAGKDGLGFLDFVKSWAPDTPVVMITGFASVSSAVEAMKSGAEDYLTKPCGNDELVLKISRVIEKKKGQLELMRLRAEVHEKYIFENIVGKSAAMRAVFQLVQQVAETDATVLIQGETGTGKELVAKAIHYNSLRKNKAFISVNCAALTETLIESELFGHERGAFTGAMKQKLGRFERANEGTLFLDEVGDLPLSTQGKLLRALQEKEFERVGGTATIHTDIRIISATNKNLRRSIAGGTFREELFYRINVMPVTLPPLRERSEDIPLLARHFVEKYAARVNKTIEGFTSAAVQMLMRYSWPGNVRELENVVERAVVLCNQGNIDLAHLLYLTQETETQLVGQAIQQKMTEEQLTRLYARMVLGEQNGSKKETCKVLGLNFRTLQRRLKD